MLRRIVEATLQGCLALWLCGPAAAQPAPPYPPQPRIGQPGKDVVWVPTPPELVEKMLDMARVTASDYVIDLGSGDGRMVIAAARRGARALGVEFNPDLVALSRHKAAEAGVQDRATFVQDDMFEADISKATVMALYLLPEVLNRLRPKLAALPAGSRIVTNTFGFEEWENWEPDERDNVEGLICAKFCEALLWIVPARVAGTWRLADGTLTLTQVHQQITGTLTGPDGPTTISDGRLRGDAITFTAGNKVYTGRVTGLTLAGTVAINGRESGRWRAENVIR
jgi:SAM-dependent methyltransferase